MRLRWSSVGGVIGGYLDLEEEEREGALVVVPRQGREEGEEREEEVRRRVRRTPMRMPRTMASGVGMRRASFRAPERACIVVDILECLMSVLCKVIKNVKHECDAVWAQRPT